MRRLLQLIACAFVLASAELCAAATPSPASTRATTRPTITLAVTAADPSPPVSPLVLEVTFTNGGAEPISWHAPGLDTPFNSYLFLVQIRYDHADGWSEAKATNGTEISGGSGGYDRSIAPGGSLKVPLAVPIEQGREWINVRVAPRGDWAHADPVELVVSMSLNDPDLDARRAHMIAGAMPGGTPFWRHVAERYPDPVVLDALLKVVTIDNAAFVESAAGVLAAQPTLPEGAGMTLAPLVAMWAPRCEQSHCGLAALHVVSAALKTQAEPARRVVLDLLRDSHDDKLRAMLVGELSSAPGDVQWLTRAQGEIGSVLQDAKPQSDLAKRADHAWNWLGARLTQLQKEAPQE